MGVKADLSFCWASRVFLVLSHSGSNAISVSFDISCDSIHFVFETDLVLAHLSRRLVGELIVYIQASGVRPSSVRQHFQTTSPLKP